MATICCAAARGNDLFVYDERGFGADAIVDFASGDKIDLRGMHVGDIGSIDPYIVQDGGNVVISTYFGGNLERITVQNSTISAVEAGAAVRYRRRSEHHLRHGRHGTICSAAAARIACSARRAATTG